METREDIQQIASSREGRAPQNRQRDTEPKILSKRQIKKAPIIIGVLFAITLFSAIFFFIKYQDAKSSAANNPDKETAALVSQVSKLMELPADETPTVATVEDRSKLDDQPFFNKAKNGDKLLIYTNAKQAVIFRQSENKVINVGPLAISENQSAVETQE